MVNLPWPQTDEQRARHAQQRVETAAFQHTQNDTLAAQQQKIQADAAALSRHMTRQADVNQEQGRTLCGEIAQRACPNEVARRTELVQRRHELAADFQETRHELLALGQSDPAPGEEEAHDQRGAALTWRVARLERQIAQLDEQIATNEATIEQVIARAIEHENRVSKVSSNTLEREKASKIQELWLQAQAVNEEYGKQQSVLQQDRHRFFAAANTLKSVLVALGDQSPHQDGLFHDVE